MTHSHLRAHDISLAENVLVSVEGLSKAAARPDAQPPRWLARILPGTEWSEMGDRKDEDDDEDEEGQLELEGASRGVAPLREVSFEVGAGEGLGLVGDVAATRTVLSLLIGLYPPSTGRVVVRGRVAPLLRYSELNFASGSGYVGKPALKVISGFFGWPSDFLRKRWDEIVDFAHLDELDDLGFPKYSLEYKQVRTKRLVLSAIMNLDASVYVVLRSFAGTDEAMFERCSQLLEQRQREGCAIIHSGTGLEDVARYCQEAILFEEGAAICSGRLSTVAQVMRERSADAKRKRQKSLRAPVRALLAGDDNDVILGQDGGTIEFELDVFNPEHIRLALVFSDEDGRELMLRPVELSEPESGVYRVVVSIPSGLLGDGAYTGTLFALPPSPEEGSYDGDGTYALTLFDPSVYDVPPPGAEDSDEVVKETPPPVRLFSFEIASEGGGTGSTPEFGVIPDELDQGNTVEVEWDVRRVED